MASLILRRCCTKSIDTFRYAAVQQRSIMRTTFKREKIPEEHHKLGISYRSSERPSTLYDKIILVWARKYKSFAEVPPIIQRRIMSEAENKVRVKFAVFLCIAIGIAAIASAISGKRASQRGESIGLSAEKRIEELRRQGAMERAAAEGK